MIRSDNVTVVCCVVGKILLNHAGYFISELLGTFLYYKRSCIIHSFYTGLKLKM